jgi:RNA polymerase sigma-70 factor (ECF subfamily)
MNINEQLISGIRKGDQETFKQLYELFYHRLHLYALSYINDSEVAADIVQELFLHLWRNSGKMEITTSISSYLFRAIHNRSIQHLRKQKVSGKFKEIQALKLKEAEILYHHEHDFMHDSIRIDELNETIQKIYQDLPEKTRRIFTMSREQNMTNIKISRTLSIDVKTVEYHIRQALKAFRSKLSGYL